MGDLFNNISNELRQLLITALLLLVAATSHTFNQYSLAKSEKREFTKVEFGVALFIAIFTGWMFGLFTDFITDNETLIRLGVGVGGYLGVVGMNRLGIWFLERTGLSPRREPSNEDSNA